MKLIIKVLHDEGFVSRFQIFDFVFLSFFFFSCIFLALINYIIYNNWTFLAKVKLWLNENE